MDKRRLTDLLNLLQAEDESRYLQLLKCVRHLPSFITLLAPPNGWIPDTHVHTMAIRCGLKLRCPHCMRAGNASELRKKTLALMKRLFEEADGINAWVVESQRSGADLVKMLNRGPTPIAIGPIGGETYRLRAITSNNGPKAVHISLLYAPTTTIVNWSRVKGIKLTAFDSLSLAWHHYLDRFSGWLDSCTPRELVQWMQASGTRSFKKIGALRGFKPAHTAPKCRKLVYFTLNNHHHEVMARAKKQLAGLTDPELKAQYLMLIDDQVGRALKRTPAREDAIAELKREFRSLQKRLGEGEGNRLVEPSRRIQ